MILKKYLAILMMAQITMQVMAQQKINVKVGDQTFTATLLDNETASEFANRLPVTLSMDDVNGNEKYATFSQSFPGTHKMAGNIKAGNLKIWSGNGLVLFYDSFSSSYSYYDLGSIDDATGLREALGSGTVSVTFELQTTGIDEVSKSMFQASGGQSFRLNGQQAREGEKGIIITNGKKRILK